MVVGFWGFFGFVWVVHFCLPGLFLVCGGKGFMKG